MASVAILKGVGVGDKVGISIAVGVMGNFGFSLWTVGLVITGSGREGELQPVKIISMATINITCFILYSSGNPQIDY